MAIPLGNINALFSRWFGRDATQNELDYWKDRNQTELEGAIFSDARVQRAREGFTKYRGREPSSEEMATYLDAPEERLLGDLQLSDQNVFLNDLFQKHRGRPPTPEEIKIYGPAPEDRILSDLQIPEQDIAQQPVEEVPEPAPGGEEPALEETPPPVPEFEESEFFQEFLAGEAQRQTQAEQEFEGFYNDLLLESQGDFNTAKARLEEDFNRAIGVNDLEAAELIQRLNEGLETRQSVLLDDYRNALEQSGLEETAFRTEEERQAGIAERGRLVSQQQRGLFGSGIAGREEQESAATRQAALDAFNRQLEEEQQARETAFTTTFTGAQTAQQRALEDLQQGIGQTEETLQRQQEEAVQSEFERLQSQERQRAFERFLAAFPSARTV